MKSIPQISGIKVLLDKLEQQVILIVNTLQSNEKGESNECPPYISDAEVTTLETLVFELGFNITGVEKPSNEIWEVCDNFINNEKRKRISESPSQKWDNFSYYYFFKIWLKKTRLYLNYLEGYSESSGIPTFSNLNKAVFYDVALSFAGEDRGVAKKFASLLRNDNYKVFYDEYEQSQLWGKDLYVHLSDVYLNKARFCLMFLSKYYANKLWTNHERQSAQAKAFKESTEYILPIRIDDTKIPGILDTTGYLDLRVVSIEEIYKVLKEKLMISQ